MKIQRVILVDDDAPFRERLAAALVRRGLVVRQAADPAAGRALAEAEAFDAGVIDLKMPGGSGLEVVRHLRLRHPGARILVLTGHGTIATAVEAVRLGAADYMTKPADADQILAALTGAVATPGGEPTEPLAAVPSLDRVEWEHIQRVLAATGGNISQSARLLGLDRRSLQRKLGKHPPSR